MMHIVKYSIPSSANYNNYKMELQFLLHCVSNSSLKSAVSQLLWARSAILLTPVTFSSLLW